MRTKDVEKILNVSHATVHNWIKAGKLRLNKTLPNGYRDISEESVYECVASTYEPDSGKSRVVVFSGGEIIKFDVEDGVADRVRTYLSELEKVGSSVEYQ